MMKAIFSLAMGYFILSGLNFHCQYVLMKSSARMRTLFFVVYTWSHGLPVKKAIS